MNEPCNKCGQVHVTATGIKSCNGHNRSGGPCKKPPMKGTSVCKNHGGKAPQTAKKAQERRAHVFLEGKIAQLMKECDIRDMSAMDGLLEVVRHSGTMFRMLAGMVGELDTIPGMQLVGMNEEGTSPVFKNGGFTGFNHVGEEVPSALLQLYGQWADRHARACKLALDAGIDERVVRNAESTSALLFDAMGRALAAAQLSPQQAQEVRKALAQELRMLTPGGVIDVGT